MVDPATLPRRARRHPRTTAGVLLANALPFVGVLALGWSVGVVLVFYWIETGVVIAFSMAAGLVATDPGDSEDDDLALAGLLESDRRIALPAGVPPVRIRNVPVVFSGGMVFGVFWVVHGVFVWTFAWLLGGASAPRLGPWVGVAVLGVVANRGAEFHEEHVVGSGYREASAMDHVFSVLGRTLVLHVALLLGAILVFAAAALVPGAGLAFLALLVALKAPVELARTLERRDDES